MSNVQTPTGTVHAGRISNVHGKEMLIPACIQVNGFTGLRAAWPTEEAITCKKCTPTAARVAATPEEKKAARAAKRAEDKARQAQYEIDRAARRVVFLGEQIAFLTGALARTNDVAGCKAQIREYTEEMLALLG